MDGINPQAGLFQNSDGNLYGTTYAAGTNGAGTVFALTPDGTMALVTPFVGTSGAHPYAGLTKAGDGNLYGTTYNGGTGGINGHGAIYRFTTNGTVTRTYSFGGGNDGANPNGALTLGNDGNLYGTTYNGGSNYFGSIFRVSANGTFTKLYAFGSVVNTNGYPLDGAYPGAALVLGGDGNFYGTTFYGGAYGYNNGGSGYGTIFCMTPAGVVTTLYSFGKVTDAYGDPLDGANPYASLLQGSDGNFYGTTVSGGTNGYASGWGYGTVYRITPTGNLTSCYSFGTVMDGGGNPLDGANPYGGLAQGSDGSFFGTTVNGGANNLGTVFNVTVAGAGVPWLQPVKSLGASFAVKWVGLQGRSYQVQYKTNLSQPNWLNLGGSITGSGGATNQTDGATNTQRFYRVQLLP